MAEEEDLTDDEFVDDEDSIEDIVIERDDTVVDDDKVYERIIVNYWATKLHSDTVGIKKQAQQRAASRQFTKGMEIQGEVEFKGKDSKRMVIAFNEDRWKLDDDGELVKKYKKKEIAKLHRRIILKTFTELEEEKGGRWTGTLESSLIDSMSMSIGTRKPLPMFKIILPGDKYVYNLYRTHTITGQRYMFYLMDKKTQELRHFEIEGQAFAIGEDFRVEDSATGKKVAYIDGKVIDLGGKWEIKLKDKELAANSTFRQILILFACLSKFIGDVNESVTDLYKQITKKKYKFVPDAYERSFYKNPRMRR